MLDLSTTEEVVFFYQVDKSKDQRGETGEVKQPSQPQNQQLEVVEAAADRLSLRTS